VKQFLTLILIAFFGSAYAGKVNLTAEVSHSRVEVGQQFKVTYSVNSVGGSFTPPNFSQFRLLSGPNQSQSMQNINGKISRQTSISYILMANKQGEYNIPAATITVNGESYQSKPLKIEVVARTDGGLQKEQENKQLFLQAIVDKQEVFVGEKLTVTYKLFTKIGINGLELKKAPDLNGFWSHDIKNDNIQFKQEQIGGVVYQTSVLQQTVLYPQRAGTLTVDPMELILAVNVRSRQAQSIFDQMFGSFERKEIPVKSTAINIKVNSLPTKDKPANFSGAVGDFSMSLSSNKDSLSANDAIDLKLNIKGKGNLPFISAPKLNLPPGFEIYDPEIENKYSTNYNGASGSKIFNYLTIPRHEGDYTIDPYSFSYFDLESKSYKTLYSDTLTIHVAKSKDAGGLVYQANRKEEIKVINKDIHYIHLNGLSLITLDSQFYGSGLFYFLLLLFIIVVFGIWVYAKRKKTIESDEVGLRKSKANKMARKRLSKAKKNLTKGELTLFYEEISAALYGYYSDKFNIDVANLSLEKILELLRESDGIETLSTSLKSVIEEAEMARFAPSSYNVDANQLYERAVNIISQTENLKKT